MILTLLKANIQRWHREPQPALYVSTYGYHDIKVSPYQFPLTANILDNITRFALVYTLPSGAIMLKNALTESSFKVTMSPNPFDKSFSLQVQSPLKEDVTVTILDVLGKKLSCETINIKDFENHIFGSDFASGVYQAVITQGDYKEVIKIIKN